MNIIVLRTEDWEALVIDGEIVVQNHSLDIYEILNALGIDYTNHYLNDDSIEFNEWAEQFLK